MVYRIDNFIETEINPITNCKYDSSWRILTLTDSKEYQKCVGSKNGCAYTVKISRSLCKDWIMAIGDFIDFNEANKRNVILVTSEADYAAVQDYYNGHRYNDTFLRENEPSILDNM